MLESCPSRGLVWMRDVRYWVCGCGCERFGCEIIESID